MLLTHLYLYLDFSRYIHIFDCCIYMYTIQLWHVDEVDTYYNCFIIFQPSLLNHQFLKGLNIPIKSL
jgi:hypothetical protein